MNNHVKRHSDLSLKVSEVTTLVNFLIRYLQDLNSKATEYFNTKNRIITDPYYGRPNRHGSKQYLHNDTITIDSAESYNSTTYREEIKTSALKSIEQLKIALSADKFTSDQIEKEVVERVVNPVKEVLALPLLKNYKLQNKGAKYKTTLTSTITKLSKIQSFLENELPIMIEEKKREEERQKKRQNNLRSIGHGGRRSRTHRRHTHRRRTHRK
jgi:hypothetical protein